MPTLPLPSRYKLRDGTAVDLRRLPPQETLFVAWLMERLRAGARYHEMLVAIAAPGSFALGGKPQVDDDVRQRPIFRIASDMLARAAERAGVPAAAAQDAQPGVYHSVTEAARTLGISRAAVAQAIHEGRLPAYRLG